MACESLGGTHATQARMAGWLKTPLLRHTDGIS